MGFEPTGPCGHGISNTEKFDFDGFNKYLLAVRKYNGRQILSYAIRYSHILKSKKADELLILTDSRRRHAMEALACFSKYAGEYQTWKEIKERYQLKWTTDDSLDVFKSIIDGKNRYSAMVTWLKETCAKLPKSYSNVLIYDTLTGLRPDEACKSISLMHRDFDGYLNKDRMMLEHFRYPDLFIRHTKKAYISLATDSLIQVAKDCQVSSYMALRSMVKRQGLEMHMAYCRKVFATHLRTGGIEQEIIDLLQGRVPKSVFGRHYYRPDLDFDRIRKAIDSLYDTIVS